MSKRKFDQLVRIAAECFRRAAREYDQTQLRRNKYGKTEVIKSGKIIGMQG